MYVYACGFWVSYDRYNFILAISTRFLAHSTGKIQSNIESAISGANCGLRERTMHSSTEENLDVVDFL